MKDKTISEISRKFKVDRKKIHPTRPPMPTRKVQYSGEGIGRLFFGLRNVEAYVRKMILGFLPPECFHTI